jgi:gamma-glutamyl phosphate reductase
VFVVAAERYAIEERFGLGAFLSITGRSVHGAGLVVPDDLAETRAEVLRLGAPRISSIRLQVPGRGSA